MSLSRLLSDLFTESETSTDSPASTQDSAAGESTVKSETTIIFECRNCGTNVSDEATCCPACEGDDIVRYTID